MGIAAFACVAGAQAPPAADNAARAAETCATGEATGAFPLLQTLVRRFGARPTGSQTERDAAEWIAGHLTALGFEQVAIEPFPIRLWSPGRSSVTMADPERRTLVAVPLGGLVSGPVVEAPVAAFATYDAFLRAPEDAVRDRIVAILEPLPRTVDGSAYVRMVTIRNAGPGEAMKRGAVGFVLRSLATHDLAMASSGGTAVLDRPFSAFAVSPPDSERLAELAARGPVILRLESSAGWTGWGASQNVVATLPGRDSDAPAILIGAHLDSWEQGTGAIDDGFGLATVIAAAEQVARSGPRPLRSIRLVLFGAEEVTQPSPVKNFAGARAYVAQHRHELGTIAMASESDWGGGRVVRMLYPASASDAGLHARLTYALAPLGVEVAVEAQPPAGPDVGILNQAGVPLFRLDQDAADLFDTHHNSDDTLERVDRAALKQNVAAWTAALRVLADADPVSAPSR
ncbi:hypothetical protein BZG35_13220 [Brevundimonas sp. LM2]|uniref:M20/M25/M40 family metallo-hydrolase n=1 Tax=Brevundimonas sp. LM2 TaxID=1938605 RepID=UPI000983BA4B|nr:M20/M25/M40 family metallo-hydrolase [Brevundimonas sp. LM2]AQR62500.1 hypothetical protein BZG35_13220 [Brevundimonas sp. LM2]